MRTQSYLTTNLFRNVERQIEKYEDKSCRHPEHNPASMKYREAGKYEHTCPACGEVQVFEVPLVTL